MNINYDKVMQEEIESFNGRKPKLLLHSCCGPCSTAVLERIMPYFDITVLYYNPNIEPLEEYERRKATQLQLLKELNVKFMDCDYDNERWRRIVEPLKDEPEGGKRCSVCFGLRLRFVALKGKQNDFEYFTSTLTVSPHKNSKLINLIGHQVGENVGIKYLYSDFKKREGYKRSIELCKKYCLYRQNYCGCLYSKEVGEDEG